MPTPTWLEHDLDVARHLPQNCALQAALDDASGLHVIVNSQRNLWGSAGTQPWAR